MKAIETGWLLREGEVLAAADAADSPAQGLAGLSGRRDLETALLLRRARLAHSVGLPGPVDVAFLDGDLVVRGMVRLPQWRVALPRQGCRNVVVVKAGSFERWGLRVGDQVEFRAAVRP